MRLDEEVEVGGIFYVCFALLPLESALSHLSHPCVVHFPSQPASVWSFLQKLKAVKV